MKIAVDVSQSGAAPGTLLVQDRRLFLCCGKASWLELLEVQMEGKKRIAAADFLHGYAMAAGERLA